MVQGGPTESFQVPKLLFDASGAPADTLGYAEFQPLSAVRVAGQNVAFAQPLSDEPLGLRDDADSIAVTRSVAPGEMGTFSATRIGERRDTVFHRVLRYSPVPVDASTRDSLVQGAIANRIHFGFPDTAALRRAVAGAMEFPDFHPPVTEIRTGADGSLWIRREDDGGDVWRWIVLDPAGEPRGHLTLPGNATIHWTDADRVWTVETDDFDVPWLVRYRIRG